VGLAIDLSRQAWDRDEKLRQSIIEHMKEAERSSGTLIGYVENLLEERVRKANAWGGQRYGRDR